VALDPDWVQDLLEYKATLQAGGSDSGNVGRAAIDGALVVYDLEDPPYWLVPVLEARDEDGNTKPATPRR
jgi:hypothetical protein